MPKGKSRGGFRGVFDTAYDERFGARYLGRVFESVLKGVGLVQKPEDNRGDEPVRDEVLQEAFRLFDRNSDGFVSVQELQLVLQALRLKEGRRQEKCQKMVDDVDADGDGKLNFDEFKELSHRIRS